MSMPKLMLILNPTHPSRKRADDRGVVICDVEQGQTVLDAVQGEGIAISTYCGGAMDCQACRISIREVNGFSHVSPCGRKEKNILEKLGADAYERLACQTKILGDTWAHVTFETSTEEAT